MFLHSEVLRYSSSASTIRPLFEYHFIPISGYDEYFIIRVIYVTYDIVVFTYMQCGKRLII